MGSMREGDQTSTLARIREKVVEVLAERVEVEESAEGAVLVSIRLPEERPEQERLATQEWVQLARTSGAPCGTLSRSVPVKVGSWRHEVDEPLDPLNDEVSPEIKPRAVGDHSWSPTLSERDLRCGGTARIEALSRYSHGPTVAS